MATHSDGHQKTFDRVSALLAQDGFVPALPRTLEETGLSESLVEGLICKRLAAVGNESGRGIAQALCLPIGLLDHGLAGGDQQLSRLAEEHEIQALIFFRDPAGGGPVEPNFACLLQICDSRDIPLATNAGTAEALLYFLRTSPDRALIAARSWGQNPAPPREPWGRNLITSDLQG